MAGVRLSLALGLVIVLLAGCDSSASPQQVAAAERACEQVQHALAELADGYPSPSWDLLERTYARLAQAADTAPDDVDDNDSVEYVRPAIENGADAVIELMRFRRSSMESGRSLPPAEGVPDMTNGLSSVAFHCSELGVAIPEPYEEWTDAVHNR